MASCNALIVQTDAAVSLATADRVVQTSNSADTCGFGGREFVVTTRLGGEEAATTARQRNGGPGFAKAWRVVARVAAGASWVVVAGCQVIEDPREEPEMNNTANGSVTVNTRRGEIRGLRADGVLHFRGVRYAEPPVRENRFRAPLAASPWTGIWDATGFPNRCMQPDAAFLGEPMGATNEDCLFLNIVTPSIEGQRHPVLFWIHGGGFVNGSANEYDGSMLAAQGDVVVVTINYRLGLFGFLDLSPLGTEFRGSASNGFRDQVLALEWVRDNIADYGGDPRNVTIFGESAGGHSVHALLATPAADGLYHRAIAHSPGTANQPPPDLVNPLLAALGVPAERLVGKLRAMSADELLAMQATLPNVGGGIDGTVVTRSTNEGILERAAHGVPLIAGTNRDEGTFFSALFAMFAPDAQAAEQVFTTTNPGIARAVMAGADPSRYIDALKARHPDADAKALHERIFGDMFLRAAMGSTERATAAGPGGWLYRFDLPTTVELFGQEVGATHAAEIPFTFNRFNSDDPGLVFYDPEDPVVRDLAQRWSDTIIAFARTGEPNGAGLPHWPRYDSQNRQTLILDANPRIERDPNSAERKLWESVLDDD